MTLLLWARFVLLAALGTLAVLYARAEWCRRD
jgi:hypothetical protein